MTAERENISSLSTLGELLFRFFLWVFAQHYSAIEQTITNTITYCVHSEILFVLTLLQDETKTKCCFLNKLFPSFCFLLNVCLATLQYHLPKYPCQQKLQIKNLEFREAFKTFQNATEASRVHVFLLIRFDPASPSFRPEASPVGELIVCGSFPNTYPLHKLLHPMEFVLWTFG